MQSLDSVCSLVSNVVFMLVWLRTGEGEADGDSNEVAEELSRGMEILNLRYPSPQVNSILTPYHPNLMSASR